MAGPRFSERGYSISVVLPWRNTHKHNQILRAMYLYHILLHEFYNEQAFMDPSQHKVDLVRCDELLEEHPATQPCVPMARVDV